MIWLLIILLSIISSVQSQITNYNNLYGSPITFYYYKANPSTVYNSFTVNSGFGSLGATINPAYGDFVVFSFGNKSWTNDIIFGSIYINTQCNGALTTSISSFYNLGTVTYIPSGYDTIELGVNLYRFTAYGTSTPSGPTSNNTACGPSYINYRSFFNNHVVPVKLLITSITGSVVKNVIVQPGSVDVDLIYVAEPYTFSFLAQDGSGYGASGSIWYTGNGVQFSGLMTPTLTRKFSWLDSYSNYRFTLTSTDLIFTHV